MEQLKVGQKAPYFEGINQNGENIKLSNFVGKNLVLYFYPKDNTSGCTAQACNLGDNYSILLQHGYDVLGVSPDTAVSHTKFIEKYKLPFNLIADTDKTIIKQYGAWGEKKMYGKTYFGVFRKTYIIDPEGIIQFIIDKVDTKNHVDQILKNHKSR